MLVNEMLIKSAHNYPDKIGFILKDNKITYVWMESAVRKVAKYLVMNGVSKGDRIGIFSIKCIEEIIVIYAILRVGGILVHINPHYKEKQIAHIIDDCGIDVLFLHHTKEKTVRNAFPDFVPFRFIIALSGISHCVEKKIKYLRDILEEIKGELVLGDVSESDYAAIVFSSGSTGIPKGITLTHRILSDATHISTQVLENNNKDILISLTPFSFDGALSQLFTSVLVGGVLVLQSSILPRDVITTVLRERITGIHAMPSFWRMVMRRYASFAKHQYPHLRYVSIIGEIFPENELMQLKKILSNTAFFMMYGLTEAFRSTVLSPVDFFRKKGSIGKPFPGVEIHIINENGLPCGPGEIGEIVHSGYFVSPGYWNDKKNSAVAFRNNMLYTGDLGKIDEEGYLYFIGRKDNMIKTMGYRVWPEEIEACLYKLSGLHEAVIVPFADNDNSVRIKAVVSCEKHLTAKEIIDYCRKNLPYYMVPFMIEMREELPKASNYKLNKAIL